MLRALLFLSLVSATVSDNGYPRCNCDEYGLWSVDNIMECQRVSDFLIALAYFSIPIELLYFVSCSNLPFKWVLFQFIAFIVLCGLTHLFNGWTYGPHTFQLMLAVTVFKFLTALVSCATAITLITLIPLLLKMKVREFMLRKKAWDLGREVGLIKRQTEAGVHVRMLTHEIRKSIDRHTILYTTMVELYKNLDLLSCAVWMPNEDRTKMILTHELKGRNFSTFRNVSIPISDSDVVKTKSSDGVNILIPDSPLVASNTQDSSEHGSVAAIRMPMLRFSNFKGGTPEQIQTVYSILVLVLPDPQSRSWRDHEVEIVNVVADQVAVALSHAAVLEESQFMREKLEVQNRALQQAKRNALMARQARSSFRKVMSNGMRRPMHSVLGFLSMIDDGSLTPEQKDIVDTMMKTGGVLTALIDDVMDVPEKDTAKFPLETRPFSIHSLVREVACLARCLAIYWGFGFEVEVERSLPENVLGDERRVLQVIFHLVGSLFDRSTHGSFVTLRISSEGASWKPNLSDGYVNIKFEVGITGADSNNTRIDETLSFGVCKRLVQLMQGNIWAVPNPGLLLRFHIPPSIQITIPDSLDSTACPKSNSLFNGLQVLLADDDDMNRAVTQKHLEKLGCTVSSVSSGFECLGALGPSGSSFKVVIIDMQMTDLDGYEVSRRIRKFWNRNWPLIVAMTADADKEMWETSLQIGINGVIRKPVLMQGIADELRRVLYTKDATH